MNLRRRILMIILSLYRGIHNGQLALLPGRDSTPVEIFDLQAAMLPTADQISLEKGIPVRDSLHLAQLLEDYLS